MFKSSMESNQPSLEKLYVRLTIEKEEESGIVVGTTAEPETKESFILVGRFITDKNINFQEM